MKNLYILLICLMAFSACNREEWLDIKPKGVIIPQKTSDYRLLLDQVIKVGISPGFSKSYSNTDYMSDDFVITPSALNFFTKEELRMFTWSDNIFDANTEDQDWAALYGQIYVTNVIAEEIMDATGTTKEKLQLEAEAKVHNAYAYFSLVNLYAPHYTPSTASTAKGVPFRKTSEIEDVQLPKATVSEIYNHIINNVTNAIEFLPELPAGTKFKHRPSKSAAYALLARVYLYMGSYNEAKEAASKSLALQNTLLNYNELPDFFGVLGIPKQHLHPEVIWFKENIRTFRTLIVTPKLYNLYEASDQRKRRYPSLETFFGIPGDDHLLGDAFFANSRFIGFSVAEMLLIRAESSARIGELSNAIDDLNTLRKSRFPPDSYTLLKATSKEAVIELVLLERRLELAGNGLRFFDIKRLNALENAKIDITHTLDGQSVKLIAGSNNWAVPIAQKYILQSPEIGENIRD